MSNITLRNIDDTTAPNDASVRVAALYRFTSFDDPAALRGPLAELCQNAGVRGTLLLAREGLNGTIAGSDAAIADAIAYLRALPGCAEMDVKYSRASVMPFGRMKVRIKKEIVTLGVDEIDPVANVGHYVEPQDWNDLIADPDTVLIDTRNDYEVVIGTFAGAINPHTTSFREFPGWFDALTQELRDNGRTPKIAMFCTGGIRCEKSTAYARSRGVEDVYHLKGGILRYLEEIPEQKSMWDGACFVFDERVAVGHGLVETAHVVCSRCGVPHKETEDHTCSKPVTPDNDWRAPKA